MELITSLIVSLITQAIKKFGFKDKLNGLAIHLFLLALALAFSLLKFGFGYLPEMYAQSIIQIWAGAVLLYEFLYKAVYVEQVKQRE